MKLLEVAVAIPVRSVTAPPSAFPPGVPMPPSPPRPPMAATPPGAPGCPEVPGPVLPAATVAARPAEAPATAGDRIGTEGARRHRDLPVAGHRRNPTDAPPCLRTLLIVSPRLCSSDENTVGGESTCRLRFALERCAMLEHDPVRCLRAARTADARPRGKLGMESRKRRNDVGRTQSNLHKPYRGDVEKKGTTLMRGGIRSTGSNVVADRRSSARRGATRRFAASLALALVAGAAIGLPAGASTSGSDGAHLGSDGRVPTRSVGSANPTNCSNPSTIASCVMGILSPAGGNQGVFLQQTGGPVLASTHASFQYEPASSIKALIGLYAMTQVKDGDSPIDDAGSDGRHIGRTR